jgi:DNA-binding transcriptional MerR regulator
MIEQLLTTKELAELYRTSPETVRYWRAVGYGPKGRKVGRHVLYARSEVEAFWRSLQEQGAR